LEYTSDQRLGFVDVPRAKQLIRGASLQIETRSRIGSHARLQIGPRRGRPQTGVRQSVAQ
jgi:hypothetical protein